MHTNLKRIFCRNRCDLVDNNASTWKHNTWMKRIFYLTLAWDQQWRRGAVRTLEKATITFRLTRTTTKVVVSWSIIKRQPVVWYRTVHLLRRTDRLSVHEVMIFGKFVSVEVNKHFGFGKVACTGRALVRWQENGRESVSFLESCHPGWKWLIKIS